MLLLQEIYKIIIIISTGIKDIKELIISNL